MSVRERIEGVIKIVRDFHLEPIIPLEGSDRYYGYAAERDGFGDEPDHLDPSTPEGQEAWEQWGKGRLPKT